MTDLASLALEAAVTLGSASAGVIAFTWKLSSQIQDFRARLVVAEQKAIKLEADFDAFVKDEGEKWQEMSRTLGQIEGAMTGPRPPTRSRP